jgi:hypothetical protein
MPRISNFLSLDILFHCQLDFEEARDLRGFDLTLDVDVFFDREELFVVRVEDLERDLLLLEMGFCAKKDSKTERLF